MTININNLEIAISQKASAASTDYEILVYTKAIQLIKNQAIFNVTTYSNLPSAASNTGKLYFIEDIETLVWSNGTTWLRLFDKGEFSGQIWSWGTNFDGRLGDGTLTSRCSPIREFCSSTDWEKVSASFCNSGGVKSDGSIWIWGSNNCGQIGDGTTVNRCSPVRERCSATNWCRVSVGSSFTTAIKTDGSLWAWGAGQCGKLGVGSLSTICSPVREFCSATDWCQSSSGESDTGAIKTGGSLWRWGRNAGATACSPIRETCSGTNWCLVSHGQAGLGLTAAIKTDGTLWLWGCLTSCGVGGIGTADFTSINPTRETCSATNWDDVNVGDRHVTALKLDGSIWSWGSGYRGGLGDGTGASKCSPVREFCSATNWRSVGKGNSYGASAIKTDGSLWSWGYTIATGGGLADFSNKCSPVREICSFTDWLEVGTTRTHASALRGISKVPL